MTTEQTIKPEQADGVPANGRDVLSVTDERTGRHYELPIRTARSARPSCARSRCPRTTSA